jgi:hypothetical protein
MCHTKNASDYVFHCPSVTKELQQYITLSPSAIKNDQMKKCTVKTTQLHWLFMNAKHSTEETKFTSNYVGFEVLM